MLPINEKDQETVGTELEKISEVDALFRLTDAAWEATKNGFAHFMKQLFIESNAMESRVSA